jgi:ribosomal 50S subunit-recycling heat shock protein
VKGKSAHIYPDAALAAEARQRIDKWLWFARIIKSRSLAAKLVADGHVRVNSVRVSAPAKRSPLAMY